MHPRFIRRRSRSVTSSRHDSTQRRALHGQADRRAAVSSAAVDIFQPRFRRPTAHGHVRRRRLGAQVLQKIITTKFLHLHQVLRSWCRGFSSAEGWFSTGSPPLDRLNAAGGVTSGGSRFVVSGGPPPIGAESTHGQCDPPFAPSAGQTIPAMKEPPVDYPPSAAPPPSIRRPAFGDTTPAT